MKEENKSNESQNEYDKFVHALQETLGNIIFEVKTDEQGHIHSELINSKELKEKYKKLME